MVTDNEKLFVYSDMQVKEEKEVGSRIGKTFTCGSVSIGAKREKFSKIINKDELKAMCDQYPDTKIIHSEKLSTARYTKPDFTYIRA